VDPNLFVASEYGKAVKTAGEHGYWAFRPARGNDFLARWSWRRRTANWNLLPTITPRWNPKSHQSHPGSLARRNSGLVARL